jgi:hypothetical protein
MPGPTNDVYVDIVELTHRKRPGEVGAGEIDRAVVNVLDGPALEPFC